MFRILTENKNRWLVEVHILRLGINCTSYKGKGIWDMEEEKTLILEFEGIEKEKVLEIARYIRDVNFQQEVYVQEIPSNLTVVKKGE